MYKTFFINPNDFIDLYICECGVHAYDNDNWRASGIKETYDGYVIHFIIKGSGYIKHICQNKLIEEYTASEGQIFHIPPEDRYEYGPYAKDPWYYFWVVLSGSKARDFIESLDLFNEPVKNVLNKHELENSFLELIKTVEHEKDLIFNFNIAIKMYSLMSCLYNECQKPVIVKNKKEDILSGAVTFISLNINKKITVSQVATELSIDRSYLYCLFMEKYGISPSEYITKVKLDYAGELLLDNKSVKEAAYLIGYDTPQHFSRNFTKVKGLTPSKWKGNLSPNNN